MPDAASRMLRSMGLPTHDLYGLPPSHKRFPDGAQYRVEIPSTEGPEALAVVLTEAKQRDVIVHRVSQGSGVFMMTDEELDAMVVTASQAPVEVSLFARPNAGWDTSAMSRSEQGGAVAATARGQDQLRDVLMDVERAANHGIRSVLLADVGVLSVFGKLRQQGDLPGDMQAKISVMLPAANPATARLLEDLGANTLNLPTDLSLPQIAAIRAAVDIPLDIYIEAPSHLGGFIQLHRIPDIIRAASPVYLKFGLRNGPDIYPAGSHLRSVGFEMSRERVRRAQLGMELLGRASVNYQTSALGAPGLAVPKAPVHAVAPLANA